MLMYITCYVIQVLAGGGPSLLSALGLENNTMKYRCLVGGGEASRATSDDEKLFKEVCIAMTVSCAIPFLV